MKILRSNFLKNMMLGAACLAFASCSKDALVEENNQGSSPRTEIKIEVVEDSGFDPASRAAVTNLATFFESKKIYLYVDKVLSEGGTEELYGKQDLTVGEDGNLVYPQELYFPEDGSAVNIYVVATTEYSWGFDNTARPDTYFGHYITDNHWNSNSDLLYAKAENVSPQGSPLTLTFRHLCSLISVAVIVPEPNLLTRIDVLNNYNQASFDILTGNFGETSGSLGNIQASYAQASTDFESGIKYSNAYIAPQTIDPETQFIKFTYDGKEYFYSLEEDMTFVSGSQYKFHITLKETTQGGEGEPDAVRISSVINDWTPNIKNATILFD